MYKPIWLRIFILFSLLITVSCGSRTPTAIPPVTDEEFDAAVKEAHSTLGILRSALLTEKSVYDFIGLKVRFRTQDGSIDDNWTEPIDYYNGIFTIRMLDGLTYDLNEHVNQTLNIPLKNVIDWMLVEKDGNLIGGYTIRLEYAHMTPGEKEKFLKITGYQIK
jgi:uncharacterized protein YegJ (DUF2314 family)